MYDLSPKSMHHDFLTRKKLSKQRPNSAEYKLL